MNLATRPSSAAPPILLVEDNPVDIDLTCRAFARDPLAGPVHVARDGETALDFMQRWDKGEPPPGLILLDINLPGVNGFEVLRQFQHGIFALYSYRSAQQFHKFWAAGSGRDYALGGARARRQRPRPQPCTARPAP